MADKNSILIGIDVGTSSTKVVAFDLDGKALASASKDYSLSSPKPNWAEQNPEDWWQATCVTLKALSKKIDPANVAGVSFSGQMHGSVFMDKNDQVIRPCILWCDGRTAAECDEIVETVGKAKYLKVIKNLPLPSFTLPKILWLKKNEPANFKKVATVLLPKDYVRFQMTGVKCMDVADGAGTCAMEIGRKRWAKNVLKTLGIDPAIMPPLVDASEITGGLTAEAAALTGLAEGTPIIAGGGDQPVGATGTGVVKEGQVMVSLGTSGVIFAPTAKARVAGKQGMASFDHAVPGVSYLMGCVISTAGAFQWYVDTLCEQEKARARRQKVSVFDLVLEEAAKTPVCAEDLIFLPYLMGERTPHNDTNARGVFFGLSTSHTKAHMTRALIEGVCFALRDNLEIVKKAGVAIKEIRVTGGGARNSFWLQTLADILGLPVKPIESPEGGALGAAILAGVGVGVYKNFAEASRRAIRTGKVVRPKKRNTLAYEEAYKRFVALYPAVKDLYVQH